MVDANHHIFNKMNFKINYNHLIKQYRKLGRGDLDEFCESYSFALHIGQDYDSPESRKAMFSEIKEYLLEEELKRAI